MIYKVALQYIGPIWTHEAGEEKGEDEDKGNEEEEEEVGGGRVS